LDPTLYALGAFASLIVVLHIYTDATSRYRKVQDRNWLAEREDQAMKASPFRDFSDLELEKLRNVEDPEMPSLCLRLGAAVTEELQKRKDRKTGGS